MCFQLVFFSKARETIVIDGRLCIPSIAKLLSYKHWSTRRLSAPIRFQPSITRQMNEGAERFDFDGGKKKKFQQSR